MQVAERKYFKNSGSNILPIDGTFFTDPLTPDYDASVFVIALYDANNVIVTPSAGTCTVTASPIDGQFQGPSEGDSIISLTLAGADASYTMPSFAGPQIKAKIVLADVAGAVSATAFMWRY